MTLTLANPLSPNLDQFDLTASGLKFQLALFDGTSRYELSTEHGIPERTLLYLWTDKAGHISQWVFKFDVFWYKTAEGFPYSFAFKYELSAEEGDQVRLPDPNYSPLDPKTGLPSASASGPISSEHWVMADGGAAEQEPSRG